MLFETVEDEPFERQATLALSRSLDALSRAAKQAPQDNQFGSFQESVQEGVSLNLCESLAELHVGSEPTHNVEIRSSWAGHRPMSVTTPALFTFSPGQLLVIGEAARIFRRSAPRLDFTVRGAVTRLERGENQRVGIVTILASIDEKWRHVSIALNEAD